MSTVILSPDAPHACPNCGTTDPAAGARFRSKLGAFLCNRCADPNGAEAYARRDGYNAGITDALRVLGHVALDVGQRSKFAALTVFRDRLAVAFQELRQPEPDEDD